MKRCKDCGVLNVDTAEKCGSCGARGDHLIAVKEDGKEALAVGEPAAAPAVATAAAPAPAVAAPAAPRSRKRSAVGAALAVFVLLGSGVGVLSYFKSRATTVKGELPRGSGFPTVLRNESGTGPATVDRDHRLVWSVKLPTQAYGGISIDRSCLFLPLRDGKMQMRDPVDGDVVWTINPRLAAAAPPAVLDRIVVFGGPDGRFVALDCSRPRPERLWSRAIDSAVRGSPAIAGTRLLLGTEAERLVCLDLRTGDPVWSFQAEGPVRSAPAVRGTDVVVGDHRGILHAVTLAEGRARWAAPLGGPLDAAVALAKDRAVAVTAGGRASAVSLADGAVLWTRELGATATGDPCVDDTLAYVAAGTTLHALRLTDGSIAWSEPADRGFSTSPAVSGDRLYIGGNDRRMRCIDTTTGRERWGVEAGWYIAAGPTIFGGRLYFADAQGTLSCVRLENERSPDWPQAGGGPERGGVNRGGREGPDAR